MKLTVSKTEIISLAMQLLAGVATGNFSSGLSITLRMLADDIDKSNGN